MWFTCDRHSRAPIGLHGHPQTHMRTQRHQGKNKKLHGWILLCANISRMARLSLVASNHWLVLVPRLGGGGIKETTAANGEGGKRGRGQVESRKKTWRKIRGTTEYRKNAATAATTTRTYEHGFAAAAKPGAYVLVTKTCWQIKLFRKFIWNLDFLVQMPCVFLYMW